MFDISILLICFWLATITTLLFLLLEMVPSSRIKIFFPLVCGISLFIFSVIFNFQKSDGILYPLKLISLPLILPCLILSPLPIIRKKPGEGIGKFSIFFGAFIILIIFFTVSQLGINFTGQLSSYYLLWIAAAGIVAFSSLVFYGISLASPVLFQTRKEDQKNPDPQLKNKSLPFKKIIVIAGCLLFLSSPFFLIDFIGGFQTCGYFEVYTVEQSVPPDGNIIHLTEKDFRELPKLGSIMKGGIASQQKCSGYFQNCIGGGSFSCNEESLIGRYYLECFDEPSLTYKATNYLEYEGKFYYLRRTIIV